ncbi:MAG: ribosome maturation factor RimP [Burkholderiales bacterium]|nr:ribosome maturation factor RimP [Burkholderiales bacterium]
MAAKFAPHEIAAASVAGLGYELVDFEHSAHGLMRIFIDKPTGIGIEDCATVSNHLTRVFAVENIEFERLEVSSPGLDRPLKTLASFQRFIGRAVKVRLNAQLDGSRRFEGVIAAIEGETIIFVVVEEEGAASKVVGAKKPKQPKRAAANAVHAKRINVPFASIDKTRLVPEI